MKVLALVSLFLAGNAHAVSLTPIDLDPQSTSIMNDCKVYPSKREPAGILTYKANGTVRSAPIYSDLCGLVTQQWLGKILVNGSGEIAGVVLANDGEIDISGIWWKP
jgi:hypothetical protein